MLACGRHAWFKNYMIIFLQDLIKILQEKYLAIFLARFFIFCKKSLILVQDLQDLVRDLASLAKYLQDLDIPC